MCPRKRETFGLWGRRVSFSKVLSNPVSPRCFKKTCVFQRAARNRPWRTPACCRLLPYNPTLHPLWNVRVCPLREAHVKILSCKTFLAILEARLGRRLCKLVASFSACVQQVQQLQGLGHILGVFLYSSHPCSDLLCAVVSN